MKESAEIKGQITLTWYQNGAFSFGLPNDPAIAYFMLHAALDEVQERLMRVKAEHLKKANLVLVNNDGKNIKPDEWGDQP